MKSRRYIPAAPFLAAAFPVITLCAQNVDRLALWEMLRPLAVSLVFAALVLLLARLVLKDIAKSSVYSCILIGLVFSFAGARTIVQEIIPALNTNDLYQTRASIATLIVCAALLAALFVIVLRSRRYYGKLSRFLAIAIALLLIVPFFRLVRFAVIERSPERESALWDAKLAEEKNAAGELSMPNPAPDIYYIILDMYARPDVQKEHFGYDDSAFVDYLKRKGFYVAEDSHSNYPFTLWSLASSLNSEYLMNLSGGSGADPIGNTLRYMIRRNRVARMLKKCGYKYVLMNSGWEVSAKSDLADLDLPHHFVRVTEMERVLIKKSVLDVWWKDSVPYLRPYVVRCFADLAKVPETEGPKFVFAHFVCPHEPWLFDRNGNQPTDPASESRPKAWRKCYTDQVDYVNQLTEKLVDAILAKSKTPPIIILQGDHGAYDPEFYRQWCTSSAAKLPEKVIGKGFVPRMCILNAYYFPGAGHKALYAGISPVNTFRVLLNQYFGAHMKLLEDDCYIPKKGQSRDEMLPMELRRMRPIGDRLIPQRSRSVIP